MHILFFSDNFPPEVNAPASRTYEHCREWVKAGHEVTVITCVPNFPSGKVFEGYRNRLWHTEEIDGIRVIRVWSFIARNEGFAKRILDYLSYMITAFVASLFVRRVTIIIGTSPQFFAACAACASAFVKRRPWIFELRDIWPESIRAVGAVKSEAVLNFFEKIELFLYRNSTAVISVTHSFKRNLIQRGVREDKIYVITNGVDTSRFTAMPKDADLLDMLGLSGKFVAGYIGTHGMAHGLDTLLDAATILKSEGHSRIVLMLLGDGAEKARLQARAAQEGLDNVLFVDSVPKSEIARYWSILDVAVIHLRKSDLFQTVIPSKLFECMGMGLPILHGVEGESADIVIRHDVGLAIAPENPAQLVSKLVHLHSDKALRKRLSDNGPVAAERYDRSVLAMEMIEILETVTVGANRKAI